MPALPVASPCIRICLMDPRDKYCMGCLRTLDEIRGWSTMPDSQRSQINADLPRRRTETPAILPLHLLPGIGDQP